MHLDSEYRRRWIEFHLENGTIENSRQKNWREVEWERVVKIAVCMNGKRHEIDDSHPDFRAFMNFRWGGRLAIFQDTVMLNYGTLKIEPFRKYIRHDPIHIWSIGWTNGNMCFLTDIDFFTGDVAKEYQMPLSELKKHIHPRLNYDDLTA